MRAKKNPREESENSGLKDMKYFLRVKSRCLSYKLLYSSRFYSNTEITVPSLASSFNITGELLTT